MRLVQVQTEVIPWFDIPLWVSNDYDLEINPTGSVYASYRLLYSPPWGVKLPR